MEKKITFNCSGRTVILNSELFVEAILKNFVIALPEDEYDELCVRFDELFTEEEKKTFFPSQDDIFRIRLKEAFKDEIWRTPYRPYTPEFDCYSPWSYNYATGHRALLMI